MHIKLLWTGCSNCLRLESNVKSAIEKSWINATLEKITDIGDIMTYWAMGAPALVIDNKVVSSWKVNGIDEIVELINFNKSNNS